MVMMMKSEVNINGFTNEEASRITQEVNQPPGVQEQEGEEGEEVETTLRRSTRVRNPPIRFENFVGYASCYMAVCEEPITLAEAMEREDASDWRKAIEEEMQSLKENNTWELTELPKGRKAIGCKWVFKIKRKADGTVERYKARLVAKGYSQKEGIDYHETFAPVVKFTSLWSLLAIATARDMIIHQMDVKTAFLNGDLDEEIYMDQPEGQVRKGEENLVCKLKCSLYGLKQAPRAWYKRIDSFLQSEGFIRFESDHGVYRRGNGEEKVILAIWVDDLFIFGNKLDEVNKVKEGLKSEFKMTDMGEAQYLLGLQIIRDKDKGHLTLTQKKYAMEVLKRFGMENCKSVSTPMEVGLKLTKEMEPKTKEEMDKMDKVPYRAAVGSLMYLMVATRPDLAAAVGCVSQFMQNPGRVHWEAVKRIMRYVKGTLNFGLRYKREETKSAHGSY